MQKNDIKRKLNLSVCDYNKNKLCDLYNEDVDISGQAYNVYTKSEQNGWKELSFDLPYKVKEGGNYEDNHRIDYLKNEYLIRTFDGDYTDWFIISEPEVNHKGKEITCSATCGHISSLLRTKKLYLEFDDTNGIGTLPQLATIILDGTGWTLGNCDLFYEKDGTTPRVRSLKSSNKVGAYQLILNLCSLFKAKPIFHGDTKTVDIKTYNPFNNPLNAQQAAVDNAEKVFELNFGKTLGSIKRKQDTEGIITKLNVEGTYGDAGYLGIESVHPKGLDFLCDFSYFKSIGLFTQQHQDILDNYLVQTSSLKTQIKNSSSAYLTKETKLNALWGFCSYGLYNVTQRLSNTELKIDPIYVRDPSPVLKDGNTVVLLNTNGSHVYAKIKKDAGSTLDKIEIEGA